MVLLNEMAHLKNEFRDKKSGSIKVYGFDIHDQRIKRVAWHQGSSTVTKKSLIMRKCLQSLSSDLTCRSMLLATES